MTEDATYTKLRALVEPLAVSLGLRLWGLEYLPAQGRSILRIYIEAEGRPVDVEDCASLSRNLDVALDVADAIPGRYTLEVSSPGLDRRFFTPEQMSGYIGQTVEIVLRSALAAFPGQKKFQGRLLATSGADISIEAGGGTVSMNWADIKKARLVDQI